MSLVDDARKMAKTHPAGNRENTVCHLCGGRAGCYGDCPWLSLPRIVAALEAAERFVTLNHYQELLSQSLLYRALVSARAAGPE